MKYLKTVSVVMLGFAAGLGAGALRQQRSSGPETEINRLRTAMETAERTAEKATLERDRLKDEADRLRASVAEIHRLRAEVSRLTRELSESQAAQEQAARVAKKAELNQELNSKLKAAKENQDNGPISFENAPAPVQTALVAALGQRPANGVVGSSVDKNGRLTYGFKGQTSDQRSIAIRLAEDGSVLERSTEITTETVPSHIQTSAAQVFGALPISTAIEIIEGDNLVFELTAKGPESGMQAMVRNDGTLLSYSAKWRQPQQKGTPKR